MHPLAGLKVIEIARVLAGPWVGQTLADLGADVIKVESPNGDDTRGWGPPHITKDGETTSAYFHSANRGKRGITIDFNNEHQLASLKQMIETADVVIENFKVGGLHKYGLDYEAVKARNPGLVYCSITGFGQTGPYAHRAGYDFMIQGMSGIMDLTGEPDGMPQKIGVAFADVFTGLYAVIGIQAALAQRAVTGLGQQVDMALFDCLVAAQANQNMNYLATGNTPKRMGNAHPNIVPYQVFPVSDGHIIVACGNDRQFRALCDVLELRDLATDPKFETNTARLENRAELADVITNALSLWKKDTILERMEENAIPGGPINTVAEALNDPQIQHRGLVQTLQGVPTVVSPFQFSDSTLKLDRAAPNLGEHSNDDPTT